MSDLNLAVKSEAIKHESMGFTSTAPGPLFHNPHICCFLRGAFSFSCARTHTHARTHARFPLLGKWPICLKLTTSRHCQERSWDISPESCRAVIIFMERISFQRSSKVHGLETTWLRGSRVPGRVLHSPGSAAGTGREQQPWPRPSTFGGMRVPNEGQRGQKRPLLIGFVQQCICGGVRGWCGVG